MTDIVAGWFAAGVILLLAGGLAKLRDPSPTIPALGALGLPRTRFAGRALGTTEMLVAASAVIWFGPLSALAVATLYTALAIAAGRLTRSPDVGCGCLGRRDTPATALHVVLDGTFAASGLLLALDPPERLRALVDGSAARAAWLIVLAVLAARLAHLAMTQLPGAWGAPDGRNIP